MRIEELVQSKLRLIFNDESLIFDKSRFAGGLTNYNYIMNINEEEYVVRQPGIMTNVMLDRISEKYNNAVAVELGLNSQSIYLDDISGIKVSKYIKQSKNIAQAGPCAAENIKGVSDIMKKIHNSSKKFVNTFNWEEELSKYEKIIMDINGSLFSDYYKFKDLLFSFLESNISNIKLVPCHNDTVPENFIIDKNNKMYLIDWEYSGMNDPSWDVASYILESKLNDKAINNLLIEYYGQEPEESEILKIKGYMLAQDLLWTVWAMIKHYSGDDFLDYCCKRYERFKKNMINLIETKEYPISSMVEN